MRLQTNHPTKLMLSSVSVTYCTITCEIGTVDSYKLRINLYWRMISSKITRRSDYPILEVSFAVKWRCGVSNPGPLACKASALPLSYTPSIRVCWYCREISESTRSLLACTQLPLAYSHYLNNNGIVLNRS